MQRGDRQSSGHPECGPSNKRLLLRSGLLAKAISQYEKFLDIWKNADEDLPEFIDANARLARLKKMSIKAG